MQDGTTSTITTQNGKGDKNNRITDWRKYRDNYNKIKWLNEIKTKNDKNL